MKKLDFNSYSLMVIVGSLLLIGIVVLTSVSTIYSQEKFNEPYYFLFRQIIYILLGITAGFFSFKINLGFLKKWSSFILLLNIILLSLVFVPGLGFSAGGAKRWVQFGPAMIQPVEFLKISFILFFSAWMTKIPESLKGKNRKKSLRPIIITATLFLASIFILWRQPDLSSLAMILAITLLIYFLSGTPIWHTVTLLVLSTSIFAVIMFFSPHANNRINLFLNPEHDPMGLGYQTRQASIAIGSGGFFGLGLGMSKQKLGFLPETMSDTIFATLAEETGFAGSFILLSLFISFLFVGFKISKNSADKFNSLVAAGITGWIIIQAFVNMGAMLKLAPLTGIALPFISYGGSHIIAELIAVGLLLNISKNRKNLIRIS